MVPPWPDNVWLERRDISRMDFFAAHAPAEVPRWFVDSCADTIPPLPPPKDFWAAITDACVVNPGISRMDATILYNCLDGDLDPPSRLEGVFNEALRLVRESRGKHERAARARDERIFFAWRRHYAEQMIDILG